MSERLLAALCENPAAKVADLPDVSEWLSRFFGKETVLQPDEPFADQVFALAEKTFATNETRFCATHWSPYDDGYDDGPGDMSDNWHAGIRNSVGCFEGWDVNEHHSVFDPISASIAASSADTSWAYDDLGRSEIREKFAECLAEDWVPPRPQAERDQAVTKKILRLASGLSPAAVKELVEQLSDW